MYDAQRVSGMNGVRKKEIKIEGPGMKDVAESFNSIIGDSKVPLHVVWPRYARMHACVNDFIENLELLHACPLMQHPALASAAVSLHAYIAECRGAVAKWLSMELFEYESDWTLIEDEIHTEFDTKWRELKDSEWIRAIIKSLSDIIEYRAQFAPKCETHVRQRLAFIGAMPGATWQPFPFALDLKQVMALGGIGAQTQTFLCGFLVRYYDYTKQLWDMTQQPDIDVDQFIATMREAINALKRIPELNRCKRAFGRIEQSMSLFRDNFGEYYRNFVDTRNSQTIFQEFVADVATSDGSNTDPKLALEFRTIINFHRKQAEQSNDPRAAGMFAKMQTALKTVDEQLDTSNIRAAMRADAVAANASKQALIQTPAAAAAAVPASEREPDTRDVDALVEDIMGPAANTSARTTRPARGTRKPVNKRG